jgi:hypothetical protein
MMNEGSLPHMPNIHRISTILLKNLFFKTIEKMIFYLVKHLDVGLKSFISMRFFIKDLDILFVFNNIR